MLAVPMSQLDCFAASLAEIIEFCTSCFAASSRPNINHIRRMKRENPLYPLVIYDAPHREGFINPTAFAGDYCAAKYLYPLFIAFFDSAPHIDNVAYLKMWYILFETFALNSIQHLSFH